MSQIPCKHGHVDGVMHVPCYQCQSEARAKELFPNEYWATIATQADCIVEQEEMITAQAARIAEYMKEVATQSDRLSELELQLGTISNTNATLQRQRDRLVEALKFYADKGHFMIADEHAWDTVSGEPPNFWCDEAGTATIEDGSLARVIVADIEKERKENG